MDNVVIYNGNGRGGGEPNVAPVGELNETVEILVSFDKRIVDDRNSEGRGVLPLPRIAPCRRWWRRRTAQAQRH